ncbi:hypothetical protein HB364_21115 [Pseudoflavitalea sp. X16]|nr:hypothetical protein [Paraflavitalea devenefica]
MKKHQLVLPSFISALAICFNDLKSTCRIIRCEAAKMSRNGATNFPHLSCERVHEDGTATVFIQYCYKAPNRTLLHTGIKIPPNYWNQNNDVFPKNYPPLVMPLN